MRYLNGFPFNLGEFIHTLLIKKANRLPEFTRSLFDATLDAALSFTEGIAAAEVTCAFPIEVDLCL